jgi:3-hydroxyisobutyrate dehydrogenase-like beta-hydroxyacid dehydrogenase
MLGQIQIYSFAEALGLAAKFGLDVKQVVELLSQGQTGSGILTHFYANKGLKGDFEPGFTVDLAFKDQALISQLGRELGVPLYFNALVVQRIADMRARGLGAGFRPLRSGALVGAQPCHRIACSRCTLPNPIQSG